MEVPPFFGAVAPRGIGGAGEARRLLFADPDGAPALPALPDVMTTEQQLLWFGGLAGAARLGWKAPHFQSRKLTGPTAPHAACDTLVSAVRRTPGARRGGPGVGRRRAFGRDLVEMPGAGHCVALERPDAADEVDALPGRRAGRRGGDVDLEGSRALVTGGASGIGAATVALLRAGSARVAVLDIADTDADADTDTDADADTGAGAGPSPSVLAVLRHPGEEEVIGAVGRVARHLRGHRRGGAQRRGGRIRRRWWSCRATSGTGCSASTCGGRSCACARWAGP